MPHYQSDSGAMVSVSRAGLGRNTTVIGGGRERCKEWLGHRGGQRRYPNCGSTLRG
jgi:hypothetical protein